MKILNQLIIGAGLLATASPVLATGKTGTTGERPNILFILSDDHSSQAWGIYGGILRDYVKTRISAAWQPKDACSTTVFVRTRSPYPAVLRS